MHSALVSEGRQEPVKVPTGRLSLLTPRETEVCRLLAYGNMNVEIAALGECGGDSPCKLYGEAGSEESGGTGPVRHRKWTPQARITVNSPLISVVTAENLYRKSCVLTDVCGVRADSQFR